MRPRNFVEAEESVPLFDVTILSEEDHPQAFQISQEWAVATGAQSVVTQGAQGASIVTSDSVYQVPTMPLAESEIVDSVGCGDMFSIAVAADLYTSHNLRHAVGRGHVAARKKLLTAVGATEFSPASTA